MKNFFIGLLIVVSMPVFSFGEKSEYKEELSPRVITIIEELFVRDVRKRINAAVKLARHRHPRVIESLKLAVRRDSNDIVKRTALKVLGDMKASSAIPVILDAIEEESTSVRIEAMKAGIKLSTAPVNRAILKQLDSPNPFIRQEAASIAGEMSDEFIAENNVIKKIIKLNEDPSEGVRIAVVRFLGRRQAKGAVPILIFLLENDSSDLVRREASEMLGGLDDRKAINALEKVLEEQSPLLRITAALSLARLGSNSGLDEAVTGIKSSNYRVRMKACEIIGIIGDKSMEFLLEEVLDDFDARVRRAAIEALKRMENKSR